MQLYSYPLPGKADAAPVYRHIVAMDDGRVYFQDEKLLLEWDAFPVSERTLWQQLDTLPVYPRVVSFQILNNQVVAMREDGAAFIWDGVGDWQDWPVAVPGTAARAAADDGR